MKKGGVIGLTLDVTFLYKNKKVKAKVDTGANISSIDRELAKELGLGPEIKKKKVTSASGITIRPLIKAKIKVHKSKITTKFTIADRTHLKYRVLLGKNTLKRLNVLIDPNIK